MAGGSIFFCNCLMLAQQSATERLTNACSRPTKPTSNLHAQICRQFGGRLMRGVWAALLDEGKYFCSVSIMYRILRAECGVRERRDQLRHPVYSKPELLATSPNQVWSWDITKLLGPAKWTYFYLYVILDIFSRYVVGWILAPRESGTLAQLLIAETYTKQAIAPGQLTVHADRGSSMKSTLVAQLLGWSSEKLKQARQFADSLDTAAIMIVDDGIIIDEWGETAKKFNVHSIRKSFLSALYGLAVKERRINLNSTLEELGIDDNEPSLTAEEKQARVIDLLKARSGIYHPALYETAGMKARKPKRGSHPANSFWYYNNWDFNTLGTIFEKAVKSTIAEEFKKRIAGPLQMEDFNVEDVQYVRGPDSIHPAYPFRLTARDMARFGLLFLREGEWLGRQVIPKEWVTESTRVYSIADADTDYGYCGYGYGYLWWITINGNHFPDVQLKDGTFSARGAGGHYIVVIPDRKLLVVHRVNTDIQGKQVSGARFGALLKLILEAKR